MERLGRSYKVGFVERYWSDGWFGLRLWMLAFSHRDLTLELELLLLSCVASLARRDVIIVALVAPIGLTDGLPL